MSDVFSFPYSIVSEFRKERRALPEESDAGRSRDHSEEENPSCEVHGAGIEKVRCLFS